MHGFILELELLELTSDELLELVVAVLEESELLVATLLDIELGVLLAIELELVCGAEDTELCLSPPLCPPPPQALSNPTRPQNKTYL